MDHLRRPISALCPLVSALLLYACGDATLTPSPGLGAPPDASPFDPGRGGNGDGYGSGSGPSTPGLDGGPPACPEELKRCGNELTFPVVGAETAVEVRGDWGGPATWKAGVPMVKSGTTWRATLTLPLGKQFQYKFCVDPIPGGDCRVWTLEPGKTGTPPDNNGVFTSAASCTTPECAPVPVTPAGVYDWRDAVMYFVFVDRFFDGDPSNNCNVAGVSGAIGNYQGGDWRGVTQKINAGYFTDLGVNTLWITVPMQNTTERGKGIGGDSNYYSGFHGYWPKELDKAEACFGTKQDLIDLVKAAHAKKLKVLFDYAMVHLHITSSIYQQNKGWFWPNDNGRGGDCICGQSCDWNTDGKKCWFADYLPHWNFGVQAARDFSVANAVQWVKDTGIDGYRLDAIKHVEDSWLLQLRKEIDAQILATQSPKQRFYMVGETFAYDRAALQYYVDPTTKLDGQFDFPERLEITKSILMRKAPMSSLASFMDTNDGAYGATAVMSPFVGNHDIGRAIHMAEDTPLWDEWSNGDKARGWSNQPTQPDAARPYKRLANAFAVIFTNKGAPLIYYGDEYGLAGAGDPDNRRFLPWTGFNAHQTTLRNRVKKLLDIRAAHPALRRGTRRTLTANENLWVYALSIPGGETVYVAINRGDQPATVTGIPAGLTELVEGGNTTIPEQETRIWAAP